MFSSYSPTIKSSWQNKYPLKNTGLRSLVGSAKKLNTTKLHASIKEWNYTNTDQNLDPHFSKVILFCNNSSALPSQSNSMQRKYTWMTLEVDTLLIKILKQTFLKISSHYLLHQPVQRTWQQKQACTLLLSSILWFAWCKWKFRRASS